MADKSDATRDAIDLAHAKNDPRPLVALERDQLEKIKIAEEILEARFQAKKRANRIATVSQMMVGYVALAGFFANAYQNLNNKKHLEDQSEREQKKWDKEFERAKAADKYRAFFETSALVTDQANPDRRLIGYALLEEFIADRDYQQKSVVILEESLAKELRDSEKESTDGGFSEAHRNAIRQIVRTLSASPSCAELVYAARSIDRVSRHARRTDEGEGREIFGMYVRRLYGRAALICKDEQDFDAVRQPIRESLGKVPWVIGLSKTPSRADLNAAVAKMLVDRCVEEVQETGTSECPDIRTHYLRFCEDAAKSPGEWLEEKAACDAIRNWPAPVAADLDAAAAPPGE